MSEYDKKSLKQLFLLLGAILLAFLVILLVAGCAVVDTGVSPVSKLQTQMKTVKEDVDKSKKDFKDISGTVTNIEERVSVVHTDVRNLSSQVTETNNTPFWQIWLPLIGAYFIWEILKYKVIRKRKGGSDA